MSGFGLNEFSQALQMVNKFATTWASAGGATPADGTTSTGGTVGAGNSSSASKADIKEYNSLLEKKQNGRLSSSDEARLRELRSSLSKAGALNNDGSVKTRTNNDKLKAAAKAMSWEDASVFGSQYGGSAASIVQKSASKAMARQNWAQGGGGGSMSMNGSVFGGRRV